MSSSKRTLRAQGILGLSDVQMTQRLGMNEEVFRYLATESDEGFAFVWRRMPESLKRLFSKNRHRSPHGEHYP